MNHYVNKAHSGQAVFSWKMSYDNYKSRIYVIMSNLLISNFTTLGWLRLSGLSILNLIETKDILTTVLI